MDRQPHPRDTHGRRCEDRLGKGPSPSPLTIHSSLLIFHQNQITISRPAQPVYQTVIEKTRGLGLRMQAMGIGLRGIQGGAPAPQQAATAAS